MNERNEGRAVARFGPPAWLAIGIPTTAALAGLIAVTFDDASNAIANWYVRDSLSRAMEEYRTYPPAATALVLVDAQNGFLTNEPDLSEALAAIVDFARGQQYRIVYSSWDGGAIQRFPTPAHDWIAARLRGRAEAAAFPARIAPREGDTVLTPRSAFSAFSAGELDRRLKASGLEHLILAGPLTLITLDSTLRDAAQYDYHVTLLRAGRAAYSDAARAAFDRTFWRYAHSVIELEELQSLADEE